jgi:2-oxopent-4-enoate/cis-2-oxohex-4-enoate hydratase
MQVPNGATVSIRGAGLIQPRAEGEIAFLLARDLTGGNVTAEEVLDATEAVMPCFEIVDSRIRDWQIKIQDTVADNASCGVFVIGDARVGPRDIDLAAAELTMAHNGKTVATGLGSAVQGHPAAAVAWLANTLGRFGIPFRKGEIILSGSLVPLVPAGAGDRFDLSIAGIGTASIAFSA